MSGKFSFALCAISVVFVACAALVPGHAQAGFQWVTPDDSRAVAADPSSSASSAVAPVAAVTGSAGTTEDVISPVVVAGAPSSAPYEGAVAARSSGMPDYEGVPSTVVARSSASMGDGGGAASGFEVVGGAGAASDNVVADGSEPVATRKASGVVKGFANKVPLAVALRQILPNGYAFSIDPSVDMGTLVSFQGGRPWRETLQEAMMPVGLVMREQGQMVAVGYPGGGASARSARSSRSRSSARNGVVRASSRASSRYQPGAAPRELGGVEQDGDFSADVSDDGYAPQAEVSPAYSDTVSTHVSGPRVWSAARGASLRKILAGWCARAHVEFNWLAEYDYPLQATATFRGTFEDAVRSLLIGFENAQPQPVATLRANPRLGQMVLVVQSRGNSGTD